MGARGRRWMVAGVLAGAMLGGGALLAVPAQGDGPGIRPRFAEARIPAAVRAGRSARTDRSSPNRRLLSPLTPEVVAHLREVAARVEGRRDDVFAKIGDSATVNRGFMRCFADGEGIELGGRDELADTIAFFGKGNAGGRDPYRRDSLAAKVGWSAHNVLIGRPSPLLREVRAISPRFALVMFGTNDIEMRNPRVFADRMRAIVDALTVRGVIPILSTVIPRNNDREADRLVPSYGRVVRAIAENRRVPWIDLHSALEGLPDRGLMSDGVHPSTFIEGNELRACDFGPEGMHFGQNVRNLLTMQMLHRLRQTVLEDGPAPDPSGERTVGAGTVADPVRVELLPHAVMADTAAETAGRSLDRYPSCDPSKDESGPEHVYRLRVGERMRVRIEALYDRDVDVDVHLLGDRVAGNACVARADTRIVRDLEPGVHHVVIDTFVPDGTGGAPGEYVLLVERDPDAEPDTD